MTHTLRDKPAGYFKLLGSSVSHYFPTLKSAWPLFLIAPIPHLIVPWIFYLSYTLGLTAIIGSVLYTWFIFAVILYRADAELHHVKMSYSNAFSTAVTRYLTVLAGNILFFALLVVVILVEYAIWLTADVVYSSFALLILFMLLDAFLFALVYFAIPIIVLEKRHLLPAFARSAQLVLHKWFRTFLVLFTLLMIVLAVAAIGVLLFSDHTMFLVTVFNYFYQLIVYPLIVSTTLILYYDLKTRAVERETKYKQLGSESHI